LAAPQVGHAAVREVPHSLQNLSPASFWVPQFEQTMGRTSGSVVRA
jgi:hypothetical protein